MSRFLETLKSGRVLLMDGAMGTELQRAGIGEGECYEAWNLTQPEKVRAIHQAYVDAGAEVLLTNTFQANYGSLAKYGLLENDSSIRTASLRVAREAGGSDRFVLYDSGPFSKDRPRRDAWSAVGSVAVEGADAILLETASEINDLLNVHLERERWEIDGERLPILMSWTYRKDAKGAIRGIKHHSPSIPARFTRFHAVAALGVNCGRDIGMDEIIEIIRRYRQVTDLPLFARPNAGTPTRVGDRWVYPLTPEKMAERLPELLEAGVSMVGGCCGTTPEHIAAMRPIVDAWNAKRGFAP
jgi:methionine synthase I (cobalamin-dependent)